MERQITVTRLNPDFVVDVACKLCNVNALMFNNMRIRNEATIARQLTIKALNEYGYSLGEIAKYLCFSINTVKYNLLITGIWLKRNDYFKFCNLYKKLKIEIDG